MIVETFFWCRWYGWNTEIPEENEESDYFKCKSSDHNIKLSEKKCILVVDRNIKVALSFTIHTYYCFQKECGVFDDLWNFKRIITAE